MKHSSGFFRRLSIGLCLVIMVVSAYAGESEKKGACISKKENPDYQKKIQLLNANWHYSWGPDILEQAPGVEFVPMIWGVKDDQNSRAGFLEQIAKLKTGAGGKGAPGVLLGFNEPDRKDQANMTVELALELWPKLMETGYRLGSPSPRTDSQWMLEFMRRAEEKDYRVDFICVHWYGGSNVEGFISALKRYHALYGRPIWITEFACADWRAKTLADNKLTKEKVQGFMRTVLPLLDELEFVERYAWFPFDEGSRFGGPSALFRRDGSLTDLGKIYAGHK